MALYCQTKQLMCESCDLILINKTMYWENQVTLFCQTKQFIEWISDLILPNKTIYQENQVTLFCQTKTIYWVNKWPYFFKQNNSLNEWSCEQIQFTNYAIHHDYCAWYRLNSLFLSKKTGLLLASSLYWNVLLTSVLWIGYSAYCRIRQTCYISEKSKHRHSQTNTHT